MPTITTFLTYNDRAEEAAQHYVSIFKNSRILHTTHYGEGGPMPKGMVMTVRFSLDGQEYVALNGGPHFKFTEGISLLINCKTQEEIDDYSRKLTDGGEQGPCGWVTDKFGVSWQVVPTIIGELFSSAHPDKAKRAFAAMMNMKKLDIAALKKAYDGG